MTAILDGEWGTGKTVFAQQLAGELRKDDFTVIEFDAFKHDFHDDAFSALCGAVLKLSEDGKGKDDVKRSLLKKSSRIAKAMTPIAVKIITSGAVGKEECEDIRKALSDPTYLEDRIQSISQREKEIEEFQNKLDAYISGNTEKNRPLILIIDELDRCKPTFAIELLEHLKHFFRTEHMITLLVSNINFLEGACRGLYGESINGREYLEKFYDVRLSIEVSHHNNKTRGNEYLEHLWESLKAGIRCSNIRDQYFDELERLIKLRNLGLRKIEHLLAKLILTSASSGISNNLEPYILPGLTVMQLDNPGLFEECKKGPVPWSKINNYFDFKKEIDEIEGTGQILHVWAYFIVDELPSKLHMGDTPNIQERHAEFLKIINRLEFIDTSKAPW